MLKESEMMLAFKCPKELNNRINKFCEREIVVKGKYLCKVIEKALDTEEKKVVIENN